MKRETAKATRFEANAYACTTVASLLHRFALRYVCSSDKDACLEFTAPAMTMRKVKLNEWCFLWFACMPM